jgi:hypothetical protein
LENQYKAVDVEREDDQMVEKAINSSDLDDGGKLAPAGNIVSGILDEEENKKQDTRKNITVYVPLIKANMEEQTVTGIVLQPEITDAQGDIMSQEVIRKAAHNFLAKYNKNTKLGLQHKNFKVNFELYESWVAPQDVVINNVVVKAGSWIMTVKVVAKNIWEKVKKGELTGFSIGGKARVQKLTKEE